MACDKNCMNIQYSGASLPRFVLSNAVFGRAAAGAAGCTRGGHTAATSPPSQSKSVPRPPPPRLRAGMVGATCRASLLGAKSPRKPWGSRRIGGRLAQSPKSVTTNTRLRRCASPNHCASSTAHSHIPCSPTAQPSEPQPSLGAARSSSPASAPTTAAKSAPLLLLNAPGTFSHLANRSPFQSRAHSTIRIAAKKSPDRSPSSPFRLPATDKSWHGEPKTNTSI